MLAVGSAEELISFESGENLKPLLTLTWIFQDDLNDKTKDTHQEFT